MPVCMLTHNDDAHYPQELGALARGHPIPIQEKSWKNGLWHKTHHTDQEG